MLNKELLEELNKARHLQARRASRLRLEVDGRRYPILRKWKTGFALEAEDAPQLRGLVDIYDGAAHLFQCLIVTSAEEEGEVQYEFKRVTPASAVAPVDFEMSPDAPAGLLTDGR